MWTSSFSCRERTMITHKSLGSVWDSSCRLLWFWNAFMCGLFGSQQAPGGFQKASRNAFWSISGIRPKSCSRWFRGDNFKAFLAPSPKSSSWRFPGSNFGAFLPPGSKIILGGFQEAILKHFCPQDQKWLQEPSRTLLQHFTSEQYVPFFIYHVVCSLMQQLNSEHGGLFLTQEE